MAKLGAVIGLPLGGVGAVVLGAAGALVGGLIGGIVGALAADWAYSTVTEDEDVFERSAPLLYGRDLSNGVIRLQGDRCKVLILPSPGSDEPRQPVIRIEGERGLP